FYIGNPAFGKTVYESIVSGLKRSTKDWCSNAELVCQKCCWKRFVPEPETVVGDYTVQFEFCGSCFQPIMFKADGSQDFAGLSQHTQGHGNRTSAAVTDIVAFQINEAEVGEFE